MWVSDLYFMVHLILPYIIVRFKLFLYIKKWHQPGVFVSLRALALVIYETQHENINKMACAPSEDSDQPGHPHEESLDP